MKSKITLIILLSIIIFLGAVSFFLGYNYLNEKNKVEDLNTTIENLNNTIKNTEEEKIVESEEKSEIEENTTKVDDSKELEEFKIKSTYFISEDETYILILTESEAREFLSKKPENGIETRFILENSYNNGLVFEECGGYYMEDGNIILRFLGSKKINIPGVEFKEIYGTSTATLEYDEDNGVISLGDIKLYKK